MCNAITKKLSVLKGEVGMDEGVSDAFGGDVHLNGAQATQGPLESLGWTLGESFEVLQSDLGHFFQLGLEVAVT